MDPNPAEGVAAVHVLVRGRVQGVGFRFFVQRSASARRLRGWVRNLGDGRVEALAEGPQQALADWLAEVGRGPRMSEVESLDVEWREASGLEGAFQIRA